MWHLLKTIFRYLFLAFFTLLFAALLFLMPSNFVAATWQSFQADAKTDGIITQSEAIHNGRRRSRYYSSVSYAYQVNGQKYESSKLAPGWIDEGKQIEGREFADQHPVGMKVDVYYNSTDPSFSLLVRGWPKWSVGFSLGVWGILIGSYFKKGGVRTKRLWICYPLTRAAALTGLITIVFCPPILVSENLQAVGIVYLVMVPLALLFLAVSRHARADPSTAS